MNKEFFESLAALEKEKGIPKEYMIERTEAALLAAFKKDSGGLTNARVKLDEAKHDIRLYKLLTVVETVEDPRTEISLEQAREKSKRYQLGDEYQIEIKTKEFCRIAAQTAKQVIVQSIREAEHGMMVKEYEDKQDKIVTGVVVRVDPTSGHATLELGSNEMALFRHEQINGETLNVGDRVKVYVTEIRREGRGPSIVLSRTHPGLVRRLFELEVPEIADGTVEIKAVAREAGSRTKIAVVSNDPNVDPIGACIGSRGARKNSITKELAGEKIDIIPYSEDYEKFVAASLAPAAVLSVSKLDESDKAFRVIVNEDQLSLAIGKEGQNARLAAKLTGCKIDIKSSRSAMENAEAEVDNA
ncbi:MAG: transcription termination/antitermination protein NusA [Clostridia bacterium]|nr:transcription termination/antitermination protein NusA [Clostridia bacterium]